MRRAGLLLGAASALAAGLAAGGCERNPDMAPSADVPDTAAIRRAMTEPESRDALLDTMPGGEMTRGDSAASARLLEEKMP